MDRLVRNKSLCGETRHQSLQRRSGFTLTELLVTMAIITLLLGLLLPAYGKVREKIAEMQWRNDLRALALAMWMYGQDHQGSYPKVTNLAEAVPQVLKALESYLKDQKLIRRLGAPGRIGWRYWVDPQQSLSFVKQHQIRNPSRTPIGGEQFPGLDGKDPLVNFAAGHLDKTALDQCRSQHPLVIFADGHVEQLTQEELSELLVCDIVTGRPRGGVTWNPDGTIDFQLRRRQ